MHTEFVAKQFLREKFVLNTRSLSFTLFYLMSITSFQHYLFMPFYFWFNTFWLAVFCYANHLFLMGISFFVDTIWF